MLQWYQIKYGVKARMFLTDTNSFMYKTEAESVYEDLYKGR